MFRLAVPIVLYIVGFSLLVPKRRREKRFTEKTAAMGGLIYCELSGVFYYAVHNTATVRLGSIVELYGSGAGPASSGIDGPVGRSRRYWQDTNRTSSHT
jgi:hypothetical protein